MSSSNLLELHYRVYNYIKNKALSYEGRPSRELAKYRQDQIYYANRNFLISSRKELITSICNSQVIYLGDFHTFEQSSRNIQRIIKALLKNKKKFVLALEMVAQKHQYAINAYLDNAINEHDFLEEINYHESWNFPWVHYKNIFEMAKIEGFKIIGLNTEGNLQTRDLFASKIISNHIKKDPAIPLLVLYGELHIIPNKIPQKVLIQTGSSPIRQTIIHQNLDNIYWRQRQTKQNDEVVKFSNSEFNLQTSPPWIKYESMAYWYENLCDDPDFNINEYIMESGGKILSEETGENFNFICKEIVQNLDVNNLSIDQIEDYNLYDHTKFDYIEEMIMELKPNSIANFYKHLFSTNQLFKIPESNNYYCPNYSINRLSYIAGIHIFHLLAKQANISTFKILKTSNNVEHFLIFTLQSMFGFFCSKIINPHRKCDHYLDLIKKLDRKQTSSTEKKYIQLAIDIFDEKDGIEQILSKSTRKIKYEVAKIIGHIFAEYLFKIINNHNENINQQIKVMAINMIRQNIFQMPLTQETFTFLKRNIIPDKVYKSERKRFF